MAMSSSLPGSPSSPRSRYLAVTWGPSSPWYVRVHIYWSSYSIVRMRHPTNMPCETLYLSSPDCCFFIDISQVMIDPDVPGPSDPYLREHLHWYTHTHTLIRIKSWIIDCFSSTRIHTCIYISSTYIWSRYWYCSIFISLWYNLPGSSLTFRGPLMRHLVILRRSLLINIYNNPFSRLMTD